MSGLIMSAREPILTVSPPLPISPPAAIKRETAFLSRSDSENRPQPMIRITLLLLLFVISGGLPVSAEELVIATASSLNLALKELVVVYEKKMGTHVKLSFGSSGNLYSQIMNGAPFDLYFSADIAHPRKLEKAGLAIPGSLYQYAVGRIVLWAVNESDIDVTRGFDALLTPTVTKIAIANPIHAPYGQAAKAALEAAGVYEQVKSRLVYGENILQAAQFVESGAADLGVIALSLAMAPTMKSKGTYWEIPVSAYSPLTHGVVILKRSKQAESAKQFLDFLKGVQGLAILNRHGFAVPARYE